MVCVNWIDYHGDLNFFQVTKKLLEHVGFAKMLPLGHSPKLLNWFVTSET